MAGGASVERAHTHPHTHTSIKNRGTEYNVASTAVPGGKPSARYGYDIMTLTHSVVHTQGGRGDAERLPLVCVSVLSVVVKKLLAVCELKTWVYVSFAFAFVLC